jgi:ABC-type nitrate/sulfonate/bicarbonate transport system permease component
VSQFDFRAGLSEQRSWGLQAAGVAALIVVWCLVTYTGRVTPLFLPSPTQMMEGMAELIHRGLLFEALKISAVRIAKALLWVLAVGVPLGVLLGSFPAFDAFFRLPVDAFKAIPITAVFPLVILWYGIGEASKVVFLVLGALFYMILLTKNAVLSVREEYVKTAVDLGASRARVIATVLVPGALPQIWQGIIVSNAIMWTYIILAEMFNAQNGLGYLINVAGRLQRSDQVYALIILIALLVVVLEWLLRAVQRRFIRW